MKRYYETVSNESILSVSLGLLKMLETAVIINTVELGTENSDPRTPHIRGLKLKPRIIEGNDLFVLIH
jgi:hypothetical protein